MGRPVNPGLQQEPSAAPLSRVAAQPFPGGKFFAPYAGIAVSPSAGQQTPQINLRRGSVVMRRNGLPQASQISREPVAALIVPGFIASRADRSVTFAAMPLLFELKAV